MIPEIDVSELKRQMQTGEDFILLDIRSEGEVVRGMLPDAQHLPMHLIPVKMNDLPRDKTVVLYCHSGSRSYHACAYLVQQGIDNVVNLRGGILDWARSGHDLVVRQVANG